MIRHDVEEMADAARVLLSEADQTTRQATLTRDTAVPSIPATARFDAALLALLNGLRVLHGSDAAELERYALALRATHEDALRIEAEHIELIRGLTNGMG